MGDITFIVQNEDVGEKIVDAFTSIAALGGTYVSIGLQVKYVVEPCIDEGKVFVQCGAGGVRRDMAEMVSRWFGVHQPPSV